MDKLFLDDYGGQTTNELIAMNDSYRIDSLVLAFEQALAVKPRSSLTKAESVVLAVEALEREVNNGGYDQFFLNSSREFVPFIVEALELIDCPKCASITSSAIAVLNLPMNSKLDEVAIRKALFELSDDMAARLDKLDSEYYANDENIELSLFAYIERNSGQIRLV